MKGSTTPIPGAPETRRELTRLVRRTAEQSQTQNLGGAFFEVILVTDQQFEGASYLEIQCQRETDTQRSTDRHAVRCMLASLFHEGSVTWLSVHMTSAERGVIQCRQQCRRDELTDEPIKVELYLPSARLTAFFDQRLWTSSKLSIWIGVGVVTTCTERRR